MKILLLDNFDSFTYTLMHCLQLAGLDVVVQNNKASLSNITKINYAGMVLSPGPGTPTNAGNTLDVLAYYQDKLPILGICLGMQAIAQHFGGVVVKAIKPRHGKVDAVYHNGQGLLKNIESPTNCTRYHSLVVSSLPDTLIIDAITADSEIMSIRHKTLPISGLQFHPEALLTSSGQRMVTNWSESLNIA